MRITATVSIPVQIGEDAWMQKYHSKTFPVYTTIGVLLNWASKYITTPTINDLTLSESDD